MAGLVFGKYEKIRRLAEGGMGEVWLARQKGSVKGFDRLVILKALKSDLAADPGFIEQFLDEARVAATLNHPSIVALFEVGEWGDTYYIAMEYIAGDDLSRLWYAAAKRGVGLPFQVSVKIVHDAALALDHAHHAGDVHNQPLSIVHRDVSPQNIMVRADGVTKLVDFGIAKAANRVSITKTGTVKGKLQYMSPEQVRGQGVDARSDQFSLGVVLWEMCTGKRLFKGDTELATLNKILQLPIATPSSLVPGFPAELERVIVRMLERDRNKRYPRCVDVARDLRAYLDRAAAATGEIAVADFVDDILGEELRARTADLTPMVSDEGRALSEDGSGRTEERPAHIQHTPSVLLKRAADGHVERFPELQDLQQAVVAGEVTRDDLVSDDGKRWHLIGSVEAYQRFFEVRDAASSVEEALEAQDATVSGRIRRVNATREIFMEPTTQSEEQGEDASGDELMTQPIPALVDDNESDELLAPPARLTRDERARDGRDAHARAADADGSRSSTVHSASTMPIAALTSEEDDEILALSSRSGGARWVVGGMLAMLLLAAGGLLLFHDETRVRASALVGSAAPASGIDEAALFHALLKDRPVAVQAALDDVTARRESAVGRARATAAAFASMLASARARQESGLAIALDLSGDKAAASAAATEAQRYRVEAYKLASEARSLDGDAPEAFLAMASYQAERAAAVEADADLAGLERTLGSSERSPAAKQRLLDEAEAQRTLAALAGALAGKDVEVTSGANASAADARLAWGRLLVAATRAPADENIASLLEGAETDKADARYVALLAWARLADEELDADATGSDGAATGGRGVQRAATPHERAAADAASARSADDLVAAGREAQADGNAFEAAVLFRKALKQDKSRVDAWMGSGWAYIDLGKGDAAVRSFRRAVSLTNAPPEASFGLAEAYRFAGQKPQAIKAYERYLKQAPTGPDAVVAKNALAALRE